MWLNDVDEETLGMNVLMGTPPYREDDLESFGKMHWVPASMHTTKLRRVHAVSLTKKATITWIEWMRQRVKRAETSGGSTHLDALDVAGLEEVDDARYHTFLCARVVINRAIIDVCI